MYRKEGNKALLETWDWQISMEESRLKDVRRTHEYELFQKVRVPSLLMSKAEDTAVLGDPVSAAKEGIRILSTHPAHPQFEEWLDKVRDWIEKAASPEPPAASAE